MQIAMSGGLFLRKRKVNKLEKQQAVIPLGAAKDPYVLGNAGRLQYFSEDGGGKQGDSISAEMFILRVCHHTTKC